MEKNKENNSYYDYIIFFCIRILVLHFFYKIKNIIYYLLVVFGVGNLHFVIGW
jgi:hypothetical protein